MLYDFVYEYMHKHTYIHIHTMYEMCTSFMCMFYLCVHRYKHIYMYIHIHTCILIDDLFFFYFKGFEHLNAIQILKIFNRTLQFTI